MKVAKVTISLPSTVFEAVERERETSGETRSEFVVRAVEEYLRRQRARQADEEYVRGYQQFPESEDEELKAWIQAGHGALVELYRDEPPWPEEQVRACDRQEPDR